MTIVVSVLYINNLITWPTNNLHAELFFLTRLCLVQESRNS